MQIPFAYIFHSDLNKNSFWLLFLKESTALIFYILGKYCHPFLGFTDRLYAYLWKFFFIVFFFLF